MMNGITITATSNSPSIGMQSAIAIASTIADVSIGNRERHPVDVVFSAILY
jgi:hypothetical protein